MRRIHSTLIAAMLAALALVLGSTAAFASAGWSTTTQLTPDQTTQTPISVGTADGSIVAFSMNLTAGPVGNITTSRSTDGGATWSSPQLLSTTSAQDVNAVVLNNGTIAVAWAELVPNLGINRVQLRTSTDSGQSWSSPQTVSTAPTHNAGEPHLVAYGTAGLAMAWLQDDGGGWFRAMVRTTPDLSTWSSAVTLSASGSGASGAVPVVDANGHVLVSWSIYTSGAFIVQVAASAGNWAVTTLSSYGSNSARFPAAVSTGPGGFVVIWSNPTAASNPSYFISSVRTVDAGATWLTTQPLSAQAFATDPTIARTSSGSLVAAWAYPTGGYTVIQTAQGTADGSSWTAASTLTASATGEYNYAPHLAASVNNSIAMSWTYWIGTTYEVLAASSADAGSTWTQSNASSWYTGAGAVTGTSIAGLPNGGWSFTWAAGTSNLVNAFVRTLDWAAAPSPSPDSSPALANTGSQPFAPLGIALVLLIAGLSLSALRIRRNTRRHTRSS